MDGQQKSAAIIFDKKWHVAAMLVLFLAVTILLYAKTLGYGFIFIWDDYKYVVNNPDIRGLGLDNFRAVFSKYYIGNFAPVHLISYMLDYQLWGLDPAGYHFGNILLHALNGLLVYRLLIKLDLPAVPALFGAALFVLHPVQVESVAWVAERKNVLSALFFLLALLNYIDYKKNAVGAVRRYLCSLLFFVLAVLTKSAAVVLPAVLVCYDLCCSCPKYAIKLADKVPYLLLALAAGVVAIVSQNKGVVYLSDYPGGTLSGTLWTMLPVFIAYLKDLLYPLQLSPYYMVTIRTSADREVVLAAILICCLTGLGAISCKRWPRLFFFMALYVFALLPVMQLIPLLSTLKNDRYLYFPMIGVAGGAGLLLAALLQGTAKLRYLAIAIAVVLCTALGTATYFQTLIWKDNISLWQFAVRQDPDNMLAWLMLAKGYTRNGAAKDAVTALNTYKILKSKHGPLRGWEGEW